MSLRTLLVNGSSDRRLPGSTCKMTAFPDSRRTEVAETCSWRESPITSACVLARTSWAERVWVWHIRLAQRSCLSAVTSSSELHSKFVFTFMGSEKHTSELQSRLHLPFRL